MLGTCQLLCGNKLLFHLFLVLFLNATQDPRNPGAFLISSRYTNVLIKGKTHADNPQTPVESLFQLQTESNVPTELKSIEQAACGLCSTLTGTEKKKTYRVL